MEMAVVDATLRTMPVEKTVEIVRTIRASDLLSPPPKRAESSTTPPVAKPLVAPSKPGENVVPTTAVSPPVTKPLEPASPAVLAAAHSETVQAVTPDPAVVAPKVVESTLKTPERIEEAARSSTVHPVETKPAGAPIETLEELQRQWPQILTKAPPKLRRSTALAMLRSPGIVTPVAFIGGVVTLCFKYAVHMNKIGEPENKKVVAEILSACLGMPCEVNCVHEQLTNHLIKEAQRRGAEIINVEDKWTSQK
jgi:DNA polymerase-3 subunit gamma/tau